MIHNVPIKSLPQDWLWCETWCSMETKPSAKTIDLVRAETINVHFDLILPLSLLPPFSLSSPSLLSLFSLFSLSLLFPPSLSLLFPPSLSQCNNPMTKEPKLTSAVRIIEEWVDYDNEIKQLQQEAMSDTVHPPSPSPSTPPPHSSYHKEL